MPWLLEAMDEAYKKHHFWVRPKLKNLPSDYFRAHGFASFQEDKAGLDLAESHRLDGNFNGPTTTRTTKAPGRIRPRRLSARWAALRRRAPRCWG